MLPLKNVFQGCMGPGRGLNFLLDQSVCVPYLLTSINLQVRVYTPVGKEEQGKFALDVATKVLPYYKEYFNIAYPLPKIDLIAIADFSVGE